jgi:3-phosphoshikimate 1-carboxyvinyltransferase
VLIGALGDGVTEIRGFGASADTLSALSVVAQLGVEHERSGDSVRVHGVGLRGLREAAEPIDCGNAGTVMRLVSGILAGQRGRFELVGDASLSARPQERIAVPLRELGARVETVNGHAPLVIEGGDLRPIRYALPVASAQVKSAILLAGLFTTGGPTTVVEPRPTRDHTERMLSALGVRVQRRGDEVCVWPADRLPPLDVVIAGDISSAAPFVVAATLLPGSELRLAGVNVNPTRTGLLTVLDRMGARISLFNRRTVSGEPVADLEVVHADLVATTVDADEVPLLVDELPLIALAAAVAHGDSVVRGAEDLRAKESDRIETVADGLKALGARVQATSDGWRIRGVPARLRGGAMRSEGDHRIAMLGAVAGVYSKEGVEIVDSDAVAVSFPEFFELLESVTHR